MRRFLIPLLLAVALAGLASTSPAYAAPDSSQVNFDAGYSGNQHLALTYLKICGTNQNNNYVCWSQNLNYVYSKFVPNWWWKLDRGISFQITLHGYGNRTCYIQRSNYGDPETLRVTYMGNNTCSFL